MTKTAVFPTKNHNHEKCIDVALNKAISICDEQEVRFTPIRQRVLTLLWSSHKPMGAYELLDKIRLEKKNAEAPTVYRALEFLLEQHLIHKIESLNAYVGCRFPEKSHISQFFICTQCNEFAELENTDIHQAISQQAAQSGFKVAEQTIEISGLCPKCQ